MSTFPSFVNTGALSTATATSITPTLPGSRVNGNLLIAWCKSTGAATETISVDSSTSAWKIFTHLSQGAAHPMVLAYYLVDGHEVAPKFDLTSSGVCEAQVRQYAPGSTMEGGSAKGAISTHAQGATNDVTCTGVLTSFQNSLVVYLSAAATSGSTPAFVNDGGFHGSSTVSSMTATLPTTRTNNNILLAFCRTGNVTTSLTCSTTGWNEIFNQENETTECFSALYWCRVTGSEVAPDFVMSTQDNIQTWVTQYSGCDPTNPIGATQEADGGISTTLSIPGITTTGTNSVVVWSTMFFGGSGAPQIPTGFTSRATNTGNGAWADEAFATSGSTTGTVSVTYSLDVSNWTGFLVELLATQNIGVPSGFTAEDTLNLNYGVADMQVANQGSGTGNTSVTAGAPFSDASTFLVELDFVNFWA